MPEITVIMSVYKEPLEWINQSIDSILNQTYRDFELLIVNDNTENQLLFSVLDNFQQKDSRIKIINNENNIGLTKSLNRGLKEARGKYIARMDADDISRKDRFQIQYDFMEQHQQVDVCGSNSISFGNVSFFTNKCTKLPQSDFEIKLSMYFYNPIIHPTAFMRRIIKGKNISYNEGAIKAQDYMLWSELNQMGAIFANLNAPLLKYRVSPLQISRNFSSEHIKTGHLVLGNLLRQLLPNITQREIQMHYEICYSKISDISLGDKLNHLNNLYSSMEKMEYSKKYIQHLVSKYAFETCLLHHKLFKVFMIPFIKKKSLFNVYHLKKIIKTFNY